MFLRPHFCAATSPSLQKTPLPLGAVARGMITRYRWCNATSETAHCSLFVDYAMKFAFALTVAVACTLHVAAQMGVDEDHEHGRSKVSVFFEIPLREQQMFKNKKLRTLFGFSRICTSTSYLKVTRKSRRGPHTYAHVHLLVELGLLCVWLSCLPARAE